jgi:hypothetical protein
VDIAPVSPDAVTARRWGWDHWALVILLLLAWALRLPPILDNRFHADEALYGYWGLLIGQGQDLWLATVSVDKPPLMPYLVAGAQVLFGNSEFAVRLPGLAAGLLTIPLVAALSSTLYRDRWTATGAAVGVALSPFAILFSATAFTDPVMVTLGLGTCVAAARGRPGWAGLLAGMGFATKQAGLAWVPVALGLSLTQGPNLKSQISNLKSRTPNRSHSTLVIGHWSLVIGHWPLAIGHWSLFICFSLVVGLMWAWDVVRMAQGAQSFWRMGITAYGSLRPIWPHELWTRLRGWLELARYFFVSPVVNSTLLAGLPLLLWSAIRHRRYTQGALADLFLGSFLLVYSLLHWLWAFPVWDRYLLPLVPVLAILLGRTLALFASALQSKASRVPSLARHSSFVPRPSSLIILHWSLVILLVLPAWNATHSRYPIGGDHGAYDGIDKVAAFLRRLPEGTVVYQHWLGWHYDDYLFDAPVYVAYWPTPAWLAQDVRAFGGREPRYVTFPSWESPARVERALTGVGYELAPVLTTTRRDGTPSFTVYHIQPVSNP